MTLTVHPSNHHSKRSPLLGGAAAMAPLVVAYLPFALVIGSAVAAAGDPVAGWAGSWLIYGGSAHLATLHGVHDGTLMLAIATGLLVNARLIVYSASLAPHWRQQPRWFRLFAPALLIDPTWALAERNTGDSVESQRRFFLGAALTLGTAWSVTIAAGALIGEHMPALGLELAAPVCLISLVGPRLGDRRHRSAAIGGAAAVLLVTGGPAGAGMIAAIGVGSAAAALTRRPS